MGGAQWLVGDAGVRGGRAPGVTRADVQHCCLPALGRRLAHHYAVSGRARERPCELAPCDGSGDVGVLPVVPHLGDSGLPCCPRAAVIPSRGQRILRLVGGAAGLRPVAAGSTHRLLELLARLGADGYLDLHRARRRGHGRSHLRSAGCSSCCVRNVCRHRYDPPYLPPCPRDVMECAEVAPSSHAAAVPVDVSQRRLRRGAAWRLLGSDSAIAACRPRSSMQYFPRLPGAQAAIPDNTPMSAALCAERAREKRHQVHLHGV
mmetsp:Transcript_133020/g.384724  ORF Transcript_133020/g.384724 Transcript_133020/m.384724 type:complete len:262 (-) Transcript_133020:115-900(-)